MTGKEMLSEFILTLNSYLGFNDATIIDFIQIDENQIAALNKIKSLAPPANFIALCDSLISIILVDKDSFLSTNYNVSGSLETIDYSAQQFDGKNRAFTYSDTDFGFFNSKSLIQNGSIVDLSLPEYAMLWKQLQEFLERCYTIPATDKVLPLLDSIRLNTISTGFVINKNNIAFDSLRHHSYLYFAFLNSSNSTELPQNLRYSIPYLNNTIVLDSTKIYEQFFDIYDVVNELNQAPDLLSRYLKLYHILEYLVYRVYLVDLTTRVGASKFFVREFASSAESMKSKEKESFVRNFQKIFDAERVRIDTDLGVHTNPDVKNFLSKKAIVRGFDTANPERVASLVYGLRCSIVHNKESEYHMTISNSEDYEIIIPLMRQLIATLEFIIIQKISDNHSTIKYSQSQMNLY